MTKLYFNENPVVNGQRIFTRRQVRFVFDVFTINITLHTCLCLKCNRTSVRNEVICIGNRSFNVLLVGFNVILLILN